MSLYKFNLLTKYFQKITMKIKQYRLQILVNGIPLEECWESLDNNNNNIARAESSSYVRDKITQIKHESGTIHYAAVNANYGTRFSVRFSAEDATLEHPIKAYLSVDGNWDFTYYQLSDEKFRKENGFWNKDRNKKYYFKFIPTCYSNNNNNEEFHDNKFTLKKSGGPGCVSVYFYRAKWVNYCCKVPNFNIKTSMILKKKSNNNNISLFTGFDEEFHEQNNIQPGVVNLKRISKEPIAELHLHYRDSSYLISKKIISPTLLTPKSDIIREDYFEEVANKKQTELIKSSSSNTTAPIYFNQLERIDKEENFLIKEKRLDKIPSTIAKLNKRSLTYVDETDETQQSKKRAKDNFCIVQIKNPLDNSEVDILQSHNVTEDKLTKNVDEGYAEGENLSNDELSYNKIKVQSEVKSVESRTSNENEIIIIEDSDDDLPPLTPLIILKDEVICISDSDDEKVAYGAASAASRSHEKKFTKSLPKTVDDVIVLSD